jgi:peptide/nickel transport system permease protein
LEPVDKNSEESAHNFTVNSAVPPRRTLFSTMRRVRGQVQASAPTAGSSQETVALAEKQTPSDQSSSIFSRIYRTLAKDKAALAGAVIIVLFLVWSIVEGILQAIDSITRKTDYAIKILGGNPLTLDFAHSLIPPSTKSFSLLMGTDYYGHSILLSILYAAPRDALAGVIVVAVGILIGMLLGTSAALFGGWVETVFMRLTDAFLAVPALVLAIVVGILVGTGFESVLIALIVVWWPTYARFFRGQALSLKRRGFIGAARLCGTGSFKIMFRHIIPNSLDPIIAYAALDFGNVILSYSALAFLGIGVQPPIPEWGEMTSSGLSYLPGAWWWSIFPSIIILAIVISFTLVGDRLQEVLSGRIA